MVSRKGFAGRPIVRDCWLRERGYCESISTCRDTKRIVILLFDALAKDGYREGFAGNEWLCIKEEVWMWYYFNYRAIMDNEITVRHSVYVIGE